MPRIRRRQFPPCLPMLLALAVMLPAFAQPNPEGPVSIRADEAAMDENAGVFLCRGNVHIEQDNITLQADEVTVHFSGNRLEGIVASGQPVIYRELHSGSPPVLARGRQFDYLAARDRIRLTGDPSVESEGNQLRGETIVYDLTARTARAEGKSGGGGVRSILLPSSGLVKDRLPKDGN